MMNQQNVRLVAGSRKNSKVLVRDGFKYQKNKKVPNAIYWRCWRDTCRANLITDDFDSNDPNALINVRRAEDHDHEEDEDLIQIDRHKEKLLIGSFKITLGQTRGRGERESRGTLSLNAFLEARAEGGAVRHHLRIILYY